MASSPPAKTTRWGSLLSQAVAGVEARLDTILADSDDAGKPQAKPAAAAQPAKTTSTPRSGSSSRVNDRLQERLARAVAAKSGAPSPSLGSSAASASATGSPRQSIDVPSRASTDSLRRSFDTTNADTKEGAPSPKQQPPAANGDSEQADAPGRSSGEAAQTPEKPADDMTATTAAATTTTTPTTASTTEAATAATQQPSPPSNAAVEQVREARIRQLEEELQEERRQHQEEIHHYTEKMEAMQSKVQYLSRESAEAAKKAAEAAAPGSLEKKLAEKDQQIARLMEEGKNLGVTEQKHRAILKKLRLKISEDEKEVAELKTARSKAEGELQAWRLRAARVAELERALDDAHKRSSQVQKEIEGLRSDAVSKDAALADLRRQLKAAHDNAEAAKAQLNEEALAKERQRAKALEDEVAAAQLDKALAADRAKAQINEWKDKAERAAERARVLEAEAKAEAQVMERKLEAMRERAEEAASGATGDSQAKLMRQVETLQSQYAVASNNWQGIEATLLARVSNLEKERDEALQRESDMRKKAREAALRAKRHEEDLEEVRSKLPKAQDEAGAIEAQIAALKTRADEAEAARDQLKAELEAQKAAWKEEKQSERDRRGDANDRGNWLEGLPSLPGLPGPPLSPLPPQIRGSGSGSRPETPLFPNPTRTWSSELLGFQGLSNKLRKASAPSSQDDPTERLSFRRPSGQPPTRPPLPGMLISSSGSSSNVAALPLVFSPTTMTEAGGGGGGGSLASSTQHQQQQQTNSHHPPHQLPLRQASLASHHAGTAADGDLDAVLDDGLERSASPQQALMQDMVSVSTVAAGPSVQLVERMSAAIRRLESEKVAAREELARISKQRNEARSEVLVLLKDAEAGRAAAARVSELEAEVRALQARYDTTLELLGEKSELVEELRADVQDVKDMYRDLVERTIK